MLDMSEYKTNAQDQDSEYVSPWPCMSQPTSFKIYSQHYQKKKKSIYRKNGNLKQKWICSIYTILHQ